MKKLSYLLIIAIVAPIFFVTSCEGTKRHDFEEPTVEWIRFNVNDTIQYPQIDPADPKKTIMKVVKFNENPSKVEMIIIGRPLKISGGFTDNMGLSSAVVRIWGDTAMEFNVITNADTCYRYRKVPSGIQIYGYTERTIDDVLLEDKIPQEIISNNPNRTTKELKVRRSKSERNEYNFSVFCTDIEGNQDLKSFEKKPLIFLTRDSVVDILKSEGVIPKTEK